MTQEIRSVSRLRLFINLGQINPLEMEPRSVSAEITLHCDPLKALQAFTHQPYLKGWWGVAKSLIELVPGGCYNLCWQEDSSAIQFVSSGIIRDYRDGELLEVTNMVYFNPERPLLGPMDLSIYVTGSSNNCNLRVTQAGYREGEHWDWYYHAVQSAWPAALEGLKRFMEDQ